MPGRYSELEALHQRIKSIPGIDKKVCFVEPNSIERFTGRAQRVIDLRNK